MDGWLVFDEFDSISQEMFDYFMSLPDPWADWQDTGGSD